MRISPVALAVALPLGGPLRSQTPRDTGVTLIHAGRVFDSEHATMLPARDILIKGRTIDTIGTNLPVPKGARVIDLSRYTVLPGLVDAHTHLLYLENPAAGNLTMDLGNGDVVGFPSVVHVYGGRVRGNVSVLKSNGNETLDVGISSTGATSPLAWPSRTRSTFG